MLPCRVIEEAGIVARKITCFMYMYYGASWAYTLVCCTYMYITVLRQHRCGSCVATAEATTTKDDAKSELKSEGADSKPDNELLIVSRHGSSCVTARASARDVAVSGCFGRR